MSLLIYLAGKHQKQFCFFRKKTRFEPMKTPSKFIQLSLLAFLFTIVATGQQGTVTVDQPRDIDRLLEYKKDISTVKLYKIQVYSGNRSGAESAKSTFQSAFGEWPVDMVYEEPNTKIQVGDLSNRLDADKALIKIKTRYINAFIFQPKDD